MRSLPRPLLGLRVPMSACLANATVARVFLVGNTYGGCSSARLLWSGAIFSLALAVLWIQRDHRNASLRDWLINEFTLGNVSGLGNSAIDGF